MAKQHFSSQANRWLTMALRHMGLLALAAWLPSCATLTPWASRSPRPAQFTAANLGVIVNQSDPLSVEIARYYQQQRQIPAPNVIAVQFPIGRTTLSPAEFQQIKAQVDAKTPATVQGYALTWAAPYRVGCMSITSAFAFGFSDRYCASQCAPTQFNPYFNQASALPYRDYKIHPSMAIAATNFAQAKALIDRGVASDGTFPAGTAYLMNTSDKARNVRLALYLPIVEQLGSRYPIELPKADALEYKWDVMFYFTGMSQVQKIDTNHFLPGAIADHLTSAGGMLTDSPQMSSLRWLEAGATGSYGAVAEPCNFLQKFPHPGIVLDRYLKGDTLLEAYWKSVAWAGQGIFVGEPLARPFGRRP